ncbi:DUF2029 domain-containing protein, partial [Candidatus Fermentibacterales bacterium]|nr:DUF2029 domain-containing protein [Candidatus Fermentibacterales bacterium]
NCALSAGLFLVWTALARMEAGGGRLAVWKSLLTAIGCMMLVYARLPFDVTAAAFLCLLSVLLGRKGRPIGAGMAAGLALLVRLDSIVFLPLLPWRRRDFALRALPGILLALILAGSINLYRFGGVLEDGHSQDPAMGLSAPLDGIAGLLASPGKGMIWYAPMGAAAVALICLSGRRDWYAYLVPLALGLLLHSLLHDWTGGTGWGPRFLFPAIVFACIPLLARWAGEAGRSWWPVLPALWGVLICCAAVWSHVTDLERELGEDSFEAPSRQAVIWSPAHSPLFVSLERLGAGEPDLLPWRAAQERPALLAPLLAAQVLAGVLLASGSLVAGRISRRPGVAESQGVSA